MFIPETSGQWWWCLPSTPRAAESSPMAMARWNSNQQWRRCLPRRLCTKESALDTARRRWNSQWVHSGRRWDGDSDLLKIWLQQGFTEHNPYLNLGAPVLEFANDTKTDGKIAACYCSAYSAVQLCSLIQPCRCSNKLVAFIVEIIDGMCGLCKAFQNDGLGLIQHPTAVWNILYCLIMTVSVLLKYLLPI